VFIRDLRSNALELLKIIDQLVKLRTVLQTEGDWGLRQAKDIPCNQAQITWLMRGLTMKQNAELSMTKAIKIAEFTVVNQTLE